MVLVQDEDEDGEKDEDGHANNDANHDFLVAHRVGISLAEEVSEGEEWEGRCRGGAGEGSRPG